MVVGSVEDQWSHCGTYGDNCVDMVALIGEGDVA